MSISSTARAKAQATVSRAEAEVLELTTELKHRRAQLEGSDAASDLLETVSGAPVVGALADSVRGELDVDAAYQKAEIDELVARLSSAEGRLKLAKRARDALLAVVGDGS
jgi:hypothetical protein